MAVVEGHYRLIWPADVLRRAGHDIVIMPPTKRTGFQARIADMSDGTQKLVSLRVPEDADVVVMQRPGRLLQVQMVEMMRANNIAVVIDMDDDISRLHPNNIAYDTYYRQSHFAGMSWRTTEKVCAEATFVTTSTRRLLRRYAAHGRGVAIDNYVPGAYLTMPHFPTGRFGWAGTTQSHPNDLQVMGDSVRRLVKDGYRFRVVGGKSKVKECLGLDEVPEVTGSVGLESWARTMSQNLDVALCPLASTEFNSAKSRLKPIESMAVGIPWISSPREEYRRLHRESGCGIMADTPKQWVNAVKSLMDNDSLRVEQAEMGRDYMQTQTYEANAWRWWEAWEHALKLQRGGAG